MAHSRSFLLLLTIASLVIISTCACGPDRKNRIAHTMREHVSPHLSESESFGFIGMSNHRDTLLMGATHPCVGVIYTVTDSASGDMTRHFADVIFSDDYSTALSVKELDFDPVDAVKETIKEKLIEKIHEKLSE